MPAAGTSLTVESLSQARARATKPEPPSQSCRARARANRFILLMSSEILAQQLNSSTAVKSTDFNSELRFEKQKVIMRVEIAISNFC